MTEMDVKNQPDEVENVEWRYRVWMKEPGKKSPWKQIMDWPMVFQRRKAKKEDGICADTE